MGLARPRGVFARTRGRARRERSGRSAGWIWLDRAALPSLERVCILARCCLPQRVRGDDGPRLHGHVCHSARGLGSEVGTRSEEGKDLMAGRCAALASSSSGGGGSSGGRSGGGGRGSGGPRVVKGVRAPESRVKGDDDEVEERVEKGEPGCGGRYDRERVVQGPAQASECTLWAAHLSCTSATLPPHQNQVQLPSFRRRKCT